MKKESAASRARSESIVLCVDGGASTARAAIVDSTGTFFLSWIDKGLNPLLLSDHEFEARFTALVSPLLELIDLNSGSIRARVVLAGIGEPKIYAKARRIIRRVLVLYSPRIRLFLSSDISFLVGRLIDGEGIVLLAGTGSICVAVGQKKRVKVGGWGFLFDRGSGFEIGMKGVKMHLRSNDLGKKIPWLADLLEKESSRKWLETGLSGVCERVARVAKAVIEEYQKGDPSARKIVEEACNGLVEMVESSWSRVGLKGCKPVFVAGGLMKNEAFFRLFTDRLGSKVPEAQVTEVKYSLLELMLKAEGIFHL
ncbi:MAG: BadF/BadG/BcrA/BcrD ATPase family protein [bacterium]